MAEITIASYDQAVSPAFTGATATLKIWYDRQFLTSDDEIVLAGSVESPNLEVVCTIGGGGFTVTIPQFVIDSTIDGIQPTARATAILFDENGIHRETVLANFKIPNTPTSTTWPALFLYNQGSLVTLPDEFYNKNEVNALLATLGGGGGGTNTLGMSNLGNTSGTTGVASGSAIRYLFAGGNNVTLSQSLNGASGTITISAFNQSVQPVGTNTLGMSNLGNTSGDSAIRSGTGMQLVLAGGNNVTLSQSTNGSSATITISAFNQSVQPIGTASIGMSNLGNTSGTTGMVSDTSPRFVFAGGNNITLSQSLNGASGTITISAFNQSAQPVGTNTLGMSNIGNTAGDTSIRTGTGMQLVFAGGNNITLSQSTNGSSATITVSAFNQSVESHTVGVSNLGNTVGDTGAIQSGNIHAVFAGGNNITLSVSKNIPGNQQTITISAPNQSVESNTLGISNLGNTSGTSGVVSNGQVRYLFAGGNNITLSQSLNGASGTVTISAFNQSVQPIGTNTLGMSNVGNTSGDTSIRTGTGMQVVFAGGNNITLSQSTNGSSATITVSAFNQSVESQSLGMSNLGNTSGTTGIASAGQVRFLFAGGNNITLSQSLNGASGTVTISAFNQSVQPIGTNTLGMSNVGNTSGDTSIRTGTGMQVVFAGGNNITLSQSTNGSSATITVSAFNQSVESNTLGMSNLGNTSGTTGVVSAGQVRFLFAGGNNVTLSQSLNGASGTVTISAFNQSNQSLGLYAVSNTTQSSSGTVDARTLSFQGAGIASVGVSNGSVIVSVPAGAPSPVNFSAGTTSNNLGSVVFTNANNLSFGLDGATISASFNPINLGVSTGGNTSGTTGMMDGAGAQVVFVGGNNITLSQSSAASAMTITISAPAATTFNSTVFGKVHHFAQASSSLGQNSVYLYPEVMHEYVSGSVIKVPVMLTASSSAAAAQTRGYTLDFGVYTRNATNSTVLSRHYSTSYTASMSQNSNGTFNIGIITAVGNSTSYNTISASSAGLNLSASIHGARELILPFATNLPPGEYWFAMRQSSSSAGVAGAGWNISHIIGSSSTQNRMGVSINSTDIGIARNMGMGVYSVSSAALPAGISMTQINQTALLVPIYFLSGTV